MAVAKQVIHENDVVALREHVGQWPAGTVGAAVSLYDGASLVEVTDDHGRTLDLFTVANERLEIQPRYIDDAPGGVRA
jgi:hypothetical protein